MAERDIEMAVRVAEAVAKAGGRTYYVGGIVRDYLMGRPCEDVDIEVHGVSVAALQAILDELGERTEMGASFGVMGLRHYGLDVAMPRSERAVGRGHRDFEVSVDPFIGPEKAAMRRDFTINAMMRDVLTGEILDFFGGRRDLDDGVIRHVSDATFAEDPLRVFRAAQFAARFGFRVDPATVALCAGMDVGALPSERVMGELEKALAQAACPSIFFRALHEMDRLGEWFTELDALDDGTFDRAMAVPDAAASLRGGASRPLEFMTAALCVELDEDAAQQLISRLTGEARLTRYALNMSDACRRLAAGRSMEEYELMALYDGCACPGELPLLARAAARDDPEWPRTERQLREALALYRDRMAADYLMGRDLMAAGVRPGPRVGEALAVAHRLRLAGKTKEAQLRAALDYLEEGEGSGI